MSRKPLLVALAGEADLRLLAQDHPDRMPREVRLLTAADFPDVAKDFDAPPGRSQAGPGGAGRHGFGTASVQEIERSRFAAHVVRALVETWDGGGYRGILLAAGPKMLGELRRLMPEALAAHVAQQLPRDLVKLPLADLQDHLVALPPGGV